MARQVRQTLPQAPAKYDQAYIAQLADAVNRYMYQREAPAEIIAARVVLTDPPQIPTTDWPGTSGLATGTLYLKQVPGGASTDLFLTVVKQGDPQ